MFLEIIGTLLSAKAGFDVTGYVLPQSNNVTRTIFGYTSMNTFLVLLLHKDSAMSWCKKVYNDIDIHRWPPEYIEYPLFACAGLCMWLATNSFWTGFATTACSAALSGRMVDTRG